MIEHKSERSVPLDSPMKDRPPGPRTGRPRIGPDLRALVRRRMARLRLRGCAGRPAHPRLFERTVYQHTSGPGGRPTTTPRASSSMKTTHHRGGQMAAFFMPRQRRRPNNQGVPNDRRRIEVA